MSRICLLCRQNETQEMTSNKVCDECYDNAADTLEQNAELYAAAPKLLDACWAALSQLTEDREEYLEADIRQLDDAIAKAEGR